MLFGGAPAFHLTRGLVTRTLTLDNLPNDPNDQKSQEWELLKSLKGIDLKLAPSTGTRRVCRNFDIHWLPDYRIKSNYYI